MVTLSVAGRIAHQLIEADPSLLQSCARLHANFATSTPGILYNLVRLNDNLARKAAGLADYQKGSVQIDETISAKQRPDGTWVQHRYTLAEFQAWGVRLVVVETGPQLQMRANQTAAI